MQNRYIAFYRTDDIVVSFLSIICRYYMHLPNKQVYEANMLSLRLSLLSTGRCANNEIGF